MVIKHFISLKDFSRPQILSMVRRALELKRNKKPNQILQSKTLAMIFKKPSTRTRISAETGWAYYGGHPLFLGQNDLQLRSGEPLHVTAKITSSMVDCILARVGKHKEIIELMENSSVPIINALTEKYHPLQILADITTLYEEYLPNGKHL
jgi:ornithine carbamoyltransferase